MTTPRDDNTRKRVHREYKRAYRAKRKLNDPEYHEWLKARQSEYYYKNRDLVRAKLNAKNASDRIPSQVTSHQGGIKRKYPEKFARTDISNTGLKEWLYKRRGCPCAYCGEEATHIDHIVPLSGEGEHVFSNIQMLCKTCNLAKLDMSEEEFFNWIDRLRNYSARNRSNPSLTSPEWGWEPHLQRRT